MGGSRKIDLTGQRFGRLLVIEECGHKRKEIQWMCKCDCGKYFLAGGWDLRSGRTVSCGCKRREGNKSNSFRFQHKDESIARKYTNMKTRCYNPKYYLFQHYGGKGITVCDEWLGKNGFENFYHWSIKHGYKPELSLDRIDNAKGYSPDNCRWVSMKEQQNNRTNNHMITANGETHTMSEWADISGISYWTIQRRISAGWDESIAVTKEVHYHASNRNKRSA